MAAEVRLNALALPGLSPDSLGNYLASLGLLRVLSRKWPSTRIAWRDEVLQVVGGPATLDELVNELVRVADTQSEPDASKREWAQYEKAWSDAQKKGTKVKSGDPLALWQAEAPEDQLPLFAAHAVAHARVSFNPLLGSGGNAGRRDFASGWKKAVDALRSAITALGEARAAYATAVAVADRVRSEAVNQVEAQYGQATARADGARTEAARTNARNRADDARNNGITRADERHGAATERADAAVRRNVEPDLQLKYLLRGEPSDWSVQKLAAGSWFSEATKLYNSGQTPAREGQISPWAMALACEGLSFLAGGASRRLGARSRATGAFPFTTQAAAPETAGEAGRAVGEIWCPSWARPMSLAEVGTLFSRGRAELRGRGALTPAAFASAIRKRGLDAGVSQFRRFTLAHTTSANTFEPRLEGQFSVAADANQQSAASTAIGQVNSLLDQRGFPRDRKVGQRWRFEGLRGPVESALLDVAAEPTSPEAGIAMLDAVVGALDRIDRNRSFREGQVRWEPLPLEWLACLFADQHPGLEARLALSVVSGFPAAMPFTAYRFGVHWAPERSGKREYDWNTEPRWFEHTKIAPARWVWGTGQAPRLLANVLGRRLVEEEKLDSPRVQRPPGRAPLAPNARDVASWFTADVDEGLFLRWLSRLALFDWRSVPRGLREVGHRGDAGLSDADGGLALLGLLQPLIDQRPLVIRQLSTEDLLADKTGARTTEAARCLVTLARAGNFDAMFRLASSRYAMAHARLATFAATFAAHEPDRLVAALLFTLSGRDRAALFERWLRPRRRPQRGEAYA